METEVQQFEKVLSDFFGRPVVCVVNGTAVSVGCAGCGIGLGDEGLSFTNTWFRSKPFLQLVLSL